jgi:hypothetical protein
MKPAAKSSKPEEVRLSVSCLVCGRVVPAFTALSEAEVAELRPAILREYRVREDGASGEKKRPRGRLDFRLNADANWEGGFRDPDEKTSGPIDPQAGHDKAAAPSPKPRPKPKLKARRKQK